MARKRKDPGPEAARVDMGAPLAMDDCLVVFCKEHTHKGKQYANGDALKVSPSVRDRLRLLEVIH